MPRKKGPITTEDPLRMSDERYALLRRECAGYCTRCRTKLYGLEQWATEEPCDECGQPFGMAAEEMLERGLIVIGTVRP